MADLVGDEFAKWHADRGIGHTDLCAVNCRDAFTGGWIVRGIDSDIDRVMEAVEKAWQILDWNGDVIDARRLLESIGAGRERGKGFQ